MRIEIVTYKCGDNFEWHTYLININGVQMSGLSKIYRMYAKEETAIKNAIKRLNKLKYPKQ